MAVKQRLTVEEFLALPEVKPYRELVNGEVTQKMAPDLFHMGLAGQLLSELRLYSGEWGGLGGPEPRLRLSAEGQVRIYVADVAFWAKGRPLGTRRDPSPPTLAVEIRSPDETMASQREKCSFYQAAGVPVAWLVEPDARTVEVFEEGVAAGTTLTSADVLTSASLPGFAYPLREFFSILDQIG